MTSLTQKCPIESLSPVHFRSMIASPDFPLNPGDKLYPINKNNPLYCRISKYSDLTLGNKRFPSLTAAATFMQREWLNKDNVSPLDGWTRLCIKDDDGNRKTVRQTFEENWELLGAPAEVAADSVLLWKHMVSLPGVSKLTMGGDPELFHLSSVAVDAGW